MLGTGQAIGIHTGEFGQCTDTVEAGVSADGLESKHMGTGSGGLGQMAAHVCSAAQAVCENTNFQNVSYSDVTPYYWAA